MMSGWIMGGAVLLVSIYGTRRLGQISPAYIRHIRIHLLYSQHVGS